MHFTLYMLENLRAWGFLRGIHDAVRLLSLQDEFSMRIFFYVINCEKKWLIKTDLLHKIGRFLRFEEIPIFILSNCSLQKWFSSLGSCPNSIINVEHIFSCGLCRCFFIEFWSCNPTTTAMGYF